MIGVFRAREVETAMGRQEKSGFRFVSMNFEITKGEFTGKRSRFTGYINTDANAERTIVAMRTAGWKGERFGDWRGLGDCEVEITLEEEIEREPAHGKRARTFTRVAFVNRVPTLALKAPLSPDDMSEESAHYAGLLKKPAPQSVDPHTGEVTGGADDYQGPECQ